MTPTTIIVDDNMNGNGDTTIDAAVVAADVANETTSIFNGNGTIDKKQKKEQKHSNVMYLRRLLTVGVLLCAVLALKQSSSSSSESALSSPSSITVMDETATTIGVTTIPLVMNRILIRFILVVVGGKTKVMAR
mmetsp:Transcript_24560/g.28436  ORF Transcript_24560/g.28436 Transcript_24560/m.28436 type:complete len:134 (+) Transcript_24560:80-481(+)